MKFAGGMDLPNQGRDLLPEEQWAVLDKLARKTVERGMTVPAILLLESVKPLNFISSQVMVFFEPIVQTIFNFRDYDNFRLALERRESIEILLLRIEEHDALSQERERAFKKWFKQEKKKWKWYQRYLGLLTPKFEVPEEIAAKMRGEKPTTDDEKKDDSPLTGGNYEPPSGPIHPK